MANFFVNNYKRYLLKQSTPLSKYNLTIAHVIYNQRGFVL